VYAHVRESAAKLITFHKSAKIFFQKLHGELCNSLRKSEKILAYLLAETGFLLNDVLLCAHFGSFWWKFPTFVLPVLCQ